MNFFEAVFNDKLYSVSIEGYVLTNVRKIVIKLWGFIISYLCENTVTVIVVTFITLMDTFTVCYNES